MSKNRVEELEATVAELQSTVEGLTEELVESKERIRVLEAEIDADVPTRVPERRNSEGVDEDTTQEALEAEPDDVAEAAAEADKGDETQTENEAEDSGTDDIIVA